MSLLWSDEFEPNNDIEGNWTYEIGNGTNGWGNNELQHYTANNTMLSNGFLVIEAREESINGFNYSSARMISSSLFDFQYGRVDIRAVLPKGQGVWPALWMLGSSFGQNGWPSCGEIDIMELLGHVPNEVHGSLHWDNSGAYASTTAATTINTGDFSDEFHVFSIEWDANSITWFLDDIQYSTVDISSPEFNEFRAEFFFILNIAVGGNWPGSPNANTVFPQRMIVDYIRVFQ
ncbi:UNVERIFIED_CONTAM: hypothetical protein GTU68_039914 [Idotea baltica]|nr:hypothetical protein [Idotea baltica]